MAFLVIGMTSGAYGKDRRGKGAAVEDAIISGDEAAYRKARDELRNNPATATDPPETTS
jgi:hypothetical protein